MGVLHLPVGVLRAQGDTTLKGRHTPFPVSVCFFPSMYTFIFIFSAIRGGA